MCNAAVVPVHYPPAIIHPRTYSECSNGYRSLSEHEVYSQFVRLFSNSDGQQQQAEPYVAVPRPAQIFLHLHLHRMFCGLGHPGLLLIIPVRWGAFPEIYIGQGYSLYQVHIFVEG